MAKNQTVDHLKQILKTIGYKSSFGKMRKDELITTLINLKEKDFKSKAAKERADSISNASQVSRPNQSRPSKNLVAE